MEQGIAPKRGRGSGVSEQAARSLNKTLVASLGNTVLLRRVRQGGSLGNAVRGEEQTEAMVEELTTPIRVEPSHLPLPDVLLLDDEVNDHLRGLCLRAEQKGRAVARVIIHNVEEVRVTTTSSNRSRTPKVSVQ
jgi:hypothetical protein